MKISKRLLLKASFIIMFCCWLVMLPTAKGQAFGNQVTVAVSNGADPTNEPDSSSVLKEGTKKSMGSLEVSFEPLSQNGTKMESLAGIKITVTNQGKDLNAVVQLIKNINGNNKICNQENLMVGAGETKEVVIYEFPYNTEEIMTLLIRDADSESVLWQKDIRVDQKTINGMVLGVLTEDISGLGYFANNNVNILQITEEMLSSSLESYEFMDVLLLNNYTSSNLSEEKYKSLKEWVKQGGTLVVGTGPSYSKTLSVFTDDLIAGTRKDLKTIDTTFGLEQKDINSITNWTFVPEMLYQVDNYEKEYMEHYPGNYNLNPENTEGNPSEGPDGQENDGLTPVQREVLDLTIEDAKVILEDQNTTLLQAKEYGRGKIIIANIDLSLPNLSWGILGKEIVRQIVTNLSMDTKRIIASPIQRYNSYQEMNALEQGNLEGMNMRFPKTSVFFYVFMIYLVVIGPLAYFLLKKQDKSHLLWVVVPVLSVLFTGIVYMIGNGSRIREVFGNYMSIIQMKEEGHVSELNHFTLVNPNNSDYVVEATKDYRIMDNQYFGNNYSGYYYGQRRTLNSGEYNMLIDSSRENTLIELANMSAFNSNRFIAHRTYDKETPYVANISRNKEASTGTFENRTGYNYEAVYLIIDNYVFYKKEVKDQEVIDLSECQSFQISNIQEISQMDRYLPYNDNKLNYMSYSGAFGYISSLYPYDYFNESGLFIGMMDYSSNEDFENAISAKMSGFSVVAAEFAYQNESTSIETKSSYPLQSFLHQMNIEGEGDGFKYVDVYGTEPLVEYVIGLETEKMSLVDNVRTYGSLYYEVKAYNFNTKQYDVIFNENKDKLTDLKPYLKGNRLYLKYKLTGSSGGLNTLPDLTLTKEVQ